MVGTRGVLLIYSICGEAPAERGTFFRFLVHERVGISLVEVYEKGSEICLFGL